MYEGNINRADPGLPRESEVLRQFRWTELVARLAATRDLREEMGRGHDGDFHAFGSARREGNETSKGAINHSSLVDGKGDGASEAAAATNAVHGDRETE